MSSPSNTSTDRTHTPLLILHRNNTMFAAFSCTEKKENLNKKNLLSLRVLFPPNPPVRNQDPSLKKAALLMNLPTLLEKIG